MLLPRFLAGAPSPGVARRSEPRRGAWGAALACLARCLVCRPACPGFLAGLACRPACHLERCPGVPRRAASATACLACRPSVPAAALLGAAWRPRLACPERCPAWLARPLACRPAAYAAVPSGVPASATRASRSRASWPAGPKAARPRARGARESTPSAPRVPRVSSSGSSSSATVVRVVRCERDRRDFPVLQGAHPRPDRSCSSTNAATTF